MNKKMLSMGFFAAVVASSVLLTSSVSAFWPFDGLFEKGEVKAATTQRVMPVKIEPNTKTPIRSTTKEIAALIVACKNIVNIDNPKFGPHIMGGKEVGKTLSPEETISEDIVLDKTNLASYVSIRKSLIVKCNEILKMAPRFDPVMKKVEETPEKVVFQPEPRSKEMSKGILQRFTKKNN